jgi:hypothetical protein
VSPAGPVMSAVWPDAGRLRDTGWAGLAAFGRLDKAAFRPLASPNVVRPDRRHTGLMPRRGECAAWPTLAP